MTREIGLVVRATFVLAMFSTPGQCVPETLKANGASLSKTLLTILRLSALRLACLLEPPAAP